MHRIVFGIEPDGYSRPRRRSRAEYYAEFSIRWLYNVAINNKKAGGKKSQACSTTGQLLTVMNRRINDNRVYRD